MLTYTTGVPCKPYRARQAPEVCSGGGAPALRTLSYTIAVALYSDGSPSACGRHVNTASTTSAGTQYSLANPPPKIHAYTGSALSACVPAGRSTFTLRQSSLAPGGSCQWAESGQQQRHTARNRARKCCSPRAVGTAGCSCARRARAGRGARGGRAVRSAAGPSGPPRTGSLSVDRTPSVSARGGSSGEYGGGSGCGRGHGRTSEELLQGRAVYEIGPAEDRGAS